MNFQSVESMQSVVNVVNEAAAALNDKDRTIRESAIPEVLAGALGAGIGGVESFAALYGLGVVGLSAAGITSGLAAAGAIVGGGMRMSITFSITGENLLNVGRKFCLLSNGKFSLPRALYPSSGEKDGNEEGKLQRPL